MENEQKEVKAERTMADINIEYSHAAARIGDCVIKIAMQNAEIDALNGHIGALKKVMLDLNDEAKALSKASAANVQ